MNKLRKLLLTASHNDAVMKMTPEQLHREVESRQLQPLRYGKTSAQLAAVEYARDRGISTSFLLPRSLSRRRVHHGYDNTEQHGISVVRSIIAAQVEGQ